MDWNSLFGQDVLNILKNYLNCRAHIQDTDIADWIFMNALEHSGIFVSQYGLVKVNWTDRNDIDDITSYEKLTGLLTFGTMLPATDAHNMIAKSIRLDLYEMIETGAGREDFEQVLGAAAHFMKNFTKGGTTNATRDVQ